MGDQTHDLYYYNKIIFLIIFIINRNLSKFSNKKMKIHTFIMI